MSLEVETLRKLLPTGREGAVVEWLSIRLGGGDGASGGVGVCCFQGPSCRGSCDSDRAVHFEKETESE